MNKTIFEKIIDREIPADIIYENDEILAFRDIEPQAPYHILIIPKINIPTINDLNEDNCSIIGKLFLVAKELAIKYNFAEDGYRVVINCNKHGQQTVYHLHVHLLGGRQLNWPPG